MTLPKPDPSPSRDEHAAGRPGADPGRFEPGAGKRLIRERLTAEEASSEDAYVLITADQWKSTAGDLWPALRTPGLKAKLSAVLSVYQHHRIGRGLSRYSMQKGRQSAGAISYMTLFSLGALVTVGWSLFSHFFSANSSFQTLVVTSINQFVPGLISDPATGETGLVDPESLGTGSGTVVAGLIAFVVASWTAVQIIRYIVDGLRSMFGLLDYPGTMVSAYLRYFAGLGLLFLAVLITAGLSLVSTWFEEQLESLSPAAHTVIDSSAFELARLAIPTLIDFLMFMVFVRFVARIGAPYKTLLVGSIIFAVAATALRFGGGALMRVSTDPVLATIATAAALLLWVNFMARAALMICAWMVDPPAVIAKVDKVYVHTDQRPNYVTMNAPVTLKWPHNPVTGDIIPARPLGDEDEDDG